MKKIVFLLNNFTYSDGVARALLEICNILDRKKFDITVVPLYRVEQKFSEDLAEGIKIRPIFNFYFRGLSRIVSLLPPTLLYRAIIRERYDIEIAFQFGLSTVIVANSLNNSALHVAWMHGYDYGLTLRQCYLKLDEVVCVSKMNAAKLYEETNGKVNVTYCYNLLNEENVILKARLDPHIVCSTRPLLISVGRNSPEKGFMRLINVLGDLYREGFSFSLWIVGDGAEHKRLEKRITELQLNDFVKLIGYTENPYMYMAKADLYVCSSFSEGYSVACTEAAILGIPILTTRVSGANEIIHDAECGMVVGLDDDSLRDGLRAILGNSKLIYDWKIKANQTKKKFWLENRKEGVDRVFNCFYQYRKEDGQDSNWRHN